jgi:hypothetical protein
VTRDRAFVTAAYRITPDFRVRGGLEGLRTDRDGPARGAVDTRTATGTIGADYVSRLGNTIGIEARRTEGELAPAPLAGITTTNDFEENELSGVLSYGPTAATRLTGRLGRTTRKYELFPGRDFSGTTGRLSGEWGVTARTLVAFDVWREARHLVDVSASHVDTRGWSLGPRWAPTAKTAFSARIMEERRKFDTADPLIVLLVPAGPAPTEEKFRGLRLGVGHELTRRIHIGLGIDYGKRTSDVATRSHDYNSVALNARWTF